MSQNTQITKPHDCAPPVGYDVKSVSNKKNQKCAESGETQRPAQRTSAKHGSEYFNAFGAGTGCFPKNNKK